jgi:hypothetical protein
MNYPIKPFQAVIQSKGTHKQLTSRFTLLNPEGQPIYKSTPLQWNQRIVPLESGGIHDAYAHGVVSLTDPAVPRPNKKDQPSMGNLAEILAGNAYLNYKMAHGKLTNNTLQRFTHQVQAGLANGTVAVIGKANKDLMFEHCHGALAEYRSHYNQNPQHLTELAQAEADYVDRFRHAQKKSGVFNWVYTLTPELTRFVVNGNNKALNYLHGKWASLPKNYCTFVQQLKSIQPQSKD